MGLFSNKNPNESVYVGGKKHFTDVIKNSGDGNSFIWRQPEEDFNTNSTLIVMPGEEAIFIKNGQIQQVFENGTYKLTTENYPFISRLRNAFSGGISTFNCVVYFVRIAHSEEIKWGTTSPIQVRDPKLGVVTNVRARGAFRIKVSNPALFLEKMVGNNVQSADQDSILRFFESQFQMYIKSLLSQFIIASNAEVIGVCAHQMEIAIIVEPYIKNALNEYGLDLTNFSIASMDIPLDDPQRQMLENAFAQKGALNTLGPDWARIKAAEIMQSLAENPGAGGVAASGAGLGMGFAAGSAFSSIAQEMFQPFYEEKSKDEESPNGPSARFVQADAAQSDNISNENDDYVKKLKGAKDMLELGLIDSAEFEKLKKAILEKMRG